MGQVGRLNAELSEEAHDAWRQFAAEHGVSVTALLEAMAWTLGTVRIDVVERARAIDAERRARG